MLKVGTLFSGIGAPEQALKNLNIPHSVEYACEIDKFARQTYLANHETKIMLEDVTKININELPCVDLLFFGFPCQSFSFAGRQRGPNEDRGLLVNYGLDIIDQTNPKYFIFENVKGLLSKKFFDFYQYIVNRASKDYYYQLLELNSKDFGIPHFRQRIFGIGVRKDLNKQINLNFTHSHAHFKHFLESNPDPKYILNKDKTQAILNTCFNKQKNFTLENDYGEVKQANKNGLFGDKKIRYSGNIFCQNTIDIHGFIYPDNKTIRKFTPRECARLQGFPNSFIIHSKDNIAYKQFGNTITINVIEKILKQLLSE